MVRQAILDRRRSSPATASEPAIERLAAAVQHLLGVHALAEKAPLTITQAARRLGVSKSRTLLPAIAAGLVATVRWGRRRRVTMEEIERLERQGFGGKKYDKRRARQATASTRGARLTYDQARSKS